MAFFFWRTEKRSSRFTVLFLSSDTGVFFEDLIKFNNLKQLNFISNGRYYLRISFFFCISLLTAQFLLFVPNSQNFIFIPIIQFSFQTICPLIQQLFRLTSTLNPTCEHFLVAVNMSRVSFFVVVSLCMYTLSHLIPLWAKFSRTESTNF